MQTGWLDKVGKDASNIGNRRAINLTDPALKGYLNFLQAEIRQYKEGNWKPTTYGGVPFGSAPIAIMIVQEIMARLKKGGTNYILYMGDATKVFDKIKRHKIQKSIQHQLRGIKHVVKRLKVRHNRTIYTTKVTNETVKIQMTEGVAQGDPN